MESNHFVDIGSWYAIAFIGMTAINSIVTCVLDWLNRNKGDLSKKYAKLSKISPLIKKILPKSKINRALKYNNEIECFSDMTSSVHNTVFTLAFLFGLIPTALDYLLNTVGFGTYTTYAIVVSSSLVLMSVFDIPFSMYENFSIEERNGFNKSSRNEFFMDELKSLGLNLAISVPLVLLLNLIFSNFRFDIFNAFALIAVFAVIGLSMEFFSFRILKIFNNFTPLDNKNMKRRIDSMFKRSGYGKPEVYVMDASKRSTHSNAFVMGFGKNSKKIVIFDTMLKNYTDDELLSIIGHELGHAKLSHLLIVRIMNVVELSIFTTLTVLFMYNVDLLNAFGFIFINESNVAEYSTIGFLVSSAFLSNFKTLLTPIKSKISRTMEYKADEYSAKIMKSGKHLISSLIKLTSENLSDPFPSKTYESFYYSHPSLGNRIENLDKTPLRNTYGKTTSERTRPNVSQTHRHSSKLVTHG